MEIATKTKKSVVGLMVIFSTLKKWRLSNGTATKDKIGEWWANFAV